MAQPPQRPSPPPSANHDGHTNGPNHGPNHGHTTNHAATHADPARRPPHDPLGETIADVPTPHQPPQHQPAQPNKRTGSSLNGKSASRHQLDATVADAPALRSPARAPAPADAEVDLDRVYDRVSTPPTNVTIALNDDEAGRSRVGGELKRTQQVRAAVGSAFGRLLQALALTMLAASLAIFAAFDQRWIWIAPAAIALPLTLWLTTRRYHAWLGHRRYMYRLLDTLGEDVSGLEGERRVRVR